MTKIEIYLNNGKLITLEMENYQAGALAQTLNDQRILFVSVGDTIINRNLIQMISPVAVQA